MSILASSADSVVSHAGAGTSWVESIRRAIRDPIELCQRLNLPLAMARAADPAAQQFAVFAPLEYVARMRPGDPNDPLLRQVLPLPEELEEVAGFSTDPLSEAAALVTPGLLHKYQGRALLVATGSCAVHCRYCFRRHFPYAENVISTRHWQPALEAIAADPSLEEVLISGGDPLMLSDQRLQQLVIALDAVPHLRRLRIHTRLPIVIPQRVTRPLLRLLQRTRLATMVVVHANHPAELGTGLDDPVCAALDRLVGAGIPVLNQAVLLRGINDDAETLVELHRRLVNHRVMPYYLHQLDRVAGSAHFETTVSDGLRLVEQMRTRLPGYAVPRYVRDVPGSPNKVPLLSPADRP